MIEEAYSKKTISDQTRVSISLEQSNVKDKSEKNSLTTMKKIKHSETKKLDYQIVQKNGPQQYMESNEKKSDIEYDEEDQSKVDLNMKPNLTLHNIQEAKENGNEENEKFNILDSLICDEDSGLFDSEKYTDNRNGAFKVS